jgi:hypothetical protein
VASVLIHPSGGDTRGKVNWAKTLEDPVDFLADGRAELLTPHERDALLQLHPDGKARFWGTFDQEWRANHIQATGPGAVVVFTADKHARGIGVIGAVLKNSSFADTLWDADAENGSYAFVYSVLGFEHVEIPYREIARMLGKGLAYPFRRLATAEGQEADAFAEAVRAGTASEPFDLDLGAELPAVPEGSSNPGTASSTVTRIVRDNTVSRWVKKLYGNRCQICGTAVETRTGTYSEGAHIRALGGGHGGPDVPSNVLCLCPNDHVRFDSGALYLKEGEVFTTGAATLIGALNVHPHHAIDWAHADYHRAHFAGA